MAKKHAASIIYLATYPPRVCGIATFTSDLIAASDKFFMPAIKTGVFAMLSNGDKKENYGDKVLGFIHAQESEDYIAAARKINSMAEVKLVNIQHEFGIFGGNWGENLNFFLDTLQKPIVTTFHTVLPDPSPELQKRVRHIVLKSDKIVVMTGPSKVILEKIYQVPADKISVIHHGIHALDYSLPREHKAGLSLSKKTFVLSSFGLLGPDKGIEYVLKSLPAVIKKHPNVIYLIIGATHPEIVKRQGESYRESLEKIIADLKLKKYVRFYNAYLELPELLEFLQATDIYIASSLNPNQAVSGTLSYALGCGRPAVATSFAQANSLITSETGILVGFKNSADISRAILNLLGDPEKMIQMGRNAYFRTRQQTWENVALSYMREFSKLIPELSVNKMHVPPIKLDHLARLTSRDGMYQFAKLNFADPASGYTLDDNCRALIAVAGYYKASKNKPALKLASVYLKFMEKTLGLDGRFKNYFDHQMIPNEFMENKDDQEDANARAIRVLMEISSFSALPKTLRRRAAKILRLRLSAGVNFEHPRAIAFYAIGLANWHSSNHSETILKELDGYCKKLVDMFKKNSSPGWQWFEKKMTYSNSILSEALLAGFVATKNRSYFAIAKKSLDFLVSQTFSKDMYIPIGQNGWYELGGERAFFDQQPEDVAATVQTLAKMFQITEQKKYADLSHKAFLWFLGDNPLGQFVYNTASGGCYDGVGEKSINLNQGAESTISYLLARLQVKGT